MGTSDRAAADAYTRSMEESRMKQIARDRMIDSALWALSGLFILVFIGLALGPPPQSPPFSLADKMFHAAGSAAIAGSLLLVAVWRPVRGKGPFPSAAAMIVIGTVAFGVAIEVAQQLVSRSAEVLDAFADLLGVTAALVVWALMRLQSSS